MTEVLSANDPLALAYAVELLGAGQLVAFPTETVYGLGADARSPEGVGRIYEAKGRPSGNPLIVHVSHAGAAQAVGVMDRRALSLAEAFWPGPLTLVVPSRGVVAPSVTAGGDTVAVRSPAHPTARALLLAFAGPVAAPSANRSGGISPTSAADVVEELGGRVRLVLDGGSCAVGIESTVLDLVGEPTILRPGSISAGQLEAILGAPIRRSRESSGTVERSPGRFGRHYAPRAKVLIGGDAPKGAAMLGITTDVGEVGERMPVSPEAYARVLYAALRRADRRGAEVIWIEAPPETDEWSGIWDRLRRSALP